MAAQNNHHSLIRKSAAILSIYIMFIEVRYIQYMLDLDEHIQQHTNTNKKK